MNKDCALYSLFLNSLFLSVIKSARTFHQTLLFALPIGFFQALALVVLLFAFGQADVHFDKAAVVMQIERHDGVARALGFAD